MLNIDAILLEGIRHQQDGESEAAEAIYRELLRRNGEHSRTLYLYGLLCLGNGRGSDAADLFRRTLCIDPAHEQAGVNRCRALLAARRFAEALLAIESELRRRPDCAEMHFLRGTALSGLGRPGKAIASLLQARAVAPGHAPTWLNLGNAYADLDRLDEAERHVRQALRLDPALVEAWASLGFVLTSLGRTQEGRAACEQAIRLRPDFAQAHWNLATAALLEGDFATGFREYEWRKRHDRYRRDFLDLPGPAWTGGTLEGSDLLVHAEQGLGDTIQLSRFVPELAARGARVTLACDRRLLRLLRTVPDLHSAVDKAAPLHPYDLWVDQMSLPGLLGTTPETIPLAGGWLHADPQAAARFAALLPSGRRAGLTWAGNPLHSNDRRRSLPERLLPQLIDAVQGAGYACISLQTGPRAAEAAENGVYDARRHLTDFADTAALLANIDLLVSVDTSTVHLAGALGLPTLTMLPFAPDWRWILGRDSTPWYSGMRLIRQSCPGDWEGVIEAVGQAVGAVTSPRCPIPLPG